MINGDFPRSKRRPSALIGSGLKQCQCQRRSYHDDGICRETFPAERNSLGQITSRYLCDQCRLEGRSRIAADLPEARGVPRCRDCEALSGLRFGTVSGLDEDGRCHACAAWYLKRLDYAANKAAGLVKTGVGWVTPIASGASVRGNRVFGTEKLTPMTLEAENGFTAPSELEGPPVSLPDLVSRRRDRFLETEVARSLVEAVGEVSGFLPAEILGKWRKVELVKARIVVAKALRARGWTLAAIGQFFGGRHHTAFVHHLNLTYQLRQQVNRQAKRKESRNG